MCKGQSSASKPFLSCKSSPNYTKPPFGPRSFEVAIIWPGIDLSVNISILCRPLPTTEPTGYPDETVSMLQLCCHPPPEECSKRLYLSVDSPTTVWIFVILVSPKKRWANYTVVVQKFLFWISPRLKQCCFPCYPPIRQFGSARNTPWSDICDICHFSWCSSNYCILDSLNVVKIQSNSFCLILCGALLL